MTTPRPQHIRAAQDNITSLMSLLQPMTGGYWLATDLKTHVHWTIPAGYLHPVIKSPDDRICRAFGLATICAPDGVPVFLINERDTLDWIEPERILAVRELGDKTCEIRLERLDDLDVRLIDAFNLHRGSHNSSFRTIAVGGSRYLQIYEDQLPTGSPDADAALRMIELTVDARHRLIGPNAGTLDVLEQMAADLTQTLRACPVHSYIWAAVLQERIAGLRQLLAA